MKFEKIKSKGEIKDSFSGNYLIDSSEKEARKIIASLGDKNFGGNIGVLGRDDAFNRRAVETLKINYLFSPERGEKRDSLKQRDSGINHVVAKEAANKGIAIVIDFDEVSRLKSKEKAIRIGRIIQNIKICRKAQCKIKIFGSVDKTSLISFVF